MFSLKKIKEQWLGTIATVGFFFTLLGAYYQYRSDQHDFGGSMNATYHSKLLNNREARTIVVCMEDTTVDLTNLYVTPTFDNPTEYSLKDFSLSFDAECTNVRIVPTSFVEAHEYEENEWIYKYKDNVLVAHDDTKKPFSYFVVTDLKGRCYIKTKASYDGATDAFRYNTDVWFIVEPNKRHLSYEDWKINCKKRIFEVVEDKFYDVYYYTHNNKPEYQFDVALGSSDNESPNQLTKNNSNRHNHNYNQESTAKSVESLNPAVEIDHLDNNVTVQNTHVENSPSDPKCIGIEDFHVVPKNSYNSLVINIDNNLTSGVEYLLLFNCRDTLNHEYNMYNYVTSDSKTFEKQYTFYYSKDVDLSKISSLKLLQNSNVEDFIKVVSTSEYEIMNISEYEIICVIRYSDNTISYRTLKGGEKVKLKDIGSRPILVFNTGVKNEVLSQSTSLFGLESSGPGTIGYFLRLLLLVLLMSIWIFGLMAWLFFIVSFAMNFSEYGYKNAKENLVNDFNSLKINHILNDKDGFWLKMWFLYISISFFLSPIITFILFFVL